jgi:hypothetical protein
MPRPSFPRGKKEKMSFNQQASPSISVPFCDTVDLSSQQVHLVPDDEGRQEPVAEAGTRTRRGGEKRGRNGRSPIPPPSPNTSIISALNGRKICSVDQPRQQAVGVCSSALSRQTTLNAGNLLLPRHSGMKTCISIASCTWQSVTHDQSHLRVSGT